MNTPIISIIIAFLVTVLSGQAQINSNRVNPDSISSQQTMILDSIQQVSSKNQVTISGTDNRVAIENENATAVDTNSINEIDINGTDNAISIKQEANGKVVIHQNGNGNQVSIIQNKKE